MTGTPIKTRQIIGVDAGGASVVFDVYETQPSVVVATNGPRWCTAAPGLDASWGCDQPWCGVAGHHQHLGPAVTIVGAHVSMPTTSSR